MGIFLIEYLRLLSIDYYCIFNRIFHLTGTAGMLPIAGPSKFFLYGEILQFSPLPCIACRDMLAGGI